jgi:subfamily B ATP-binding cassette protein MsbA
MKQLIKYLFPFIKPYMKYIWGSVIFSFVLAGIKFYQAYLVKPIFDKGLSQESTFEQALQLSLILLGLGLLNFPARFFHFYWIRFVVDKATCNLRSEVYSKVLNCPLQFFQNNKQGEFISKLLTDTQQLSQGIRHSIDLVREPLTAACMLGLALYRDWQLTLVIFAVAPLFIIIFQKSGTKVKRYQSGVQEDLAEMTHHIGEGVGGQKIIKAFNLKDYIVKRFQKGQDRYFQSLMKTTKVEELAHPLVEFVGALAFSGVILFAHYRITSGAMTSGDFISFAVALALLMDPIRKFSQANVKLNQALASGERIFQLLSEPDEEDLGTQTPVSINEKIEFKNVTFGYHIDQPVLKDFSLTIQKGQKIALVGLSGAGKSTIINLLLRLYKPQSGEILIDGIPVDKIALKSLRNLFGLVSQDIFLFNDTVRENVLTGDFFPENELDEVLKRAGAYDFVMNMPEKLDALIGDRGAKLSGGQAQRVTIGRAFVKNPPVFLFDEATASLDNESEKAIQQAMESLAKDKIVLAVAHRLSTIQNFDSIVVLSEGKIVEKGNHQQLLEQRGHYNKLYELSSAQ